MCLHYRSLYYSREQINKRRRSTSSCLEYRSIYYIYICIYYSREQINMRKRSTSSCPEYRSLYYIYIHIYILTIETYANIETLLRLLFFICSLLHIYLYTYIDYRNICKYIDFRDVQFFFIIF